MLVTYRCGRSWVLVQSAQNETGADDDKVSRRLLRASDTKRNTNRLAQHSIEERYPAMSKMLLTISLANLPSALQSCSGNERRLAAATPNFHATTRLFPR